MQRYGSRDNGQILHRDFIGFFSILGWVEKKQIDFQFAIPQVSCELDRIKKRKKRLKKVLYVLNADALQRFPEG